ncbi:MAG: GntR family transcriptional regulator [Eubacteriales bacterium]|jgi:GntR family transcriptional regulator|nr:GntR family transcriptional regulator [Lachnospiraceae bacterium]MDD5860192.1 GntR family transcriptional regulator [Eubacteriales bacterium]MCI1334482.1 GntR family transcriptional regulator [Lachnospiraceae bacterium]MCI1358747.1 GntR family transcriptional regulator [Lachnospiraceae bacterium]MCI1379357.1 GntR family transcriptional regulator [Lachnospiraceae bacterium]
MDILIDHYSRVPIYEQIEIQIKTQIMDGTLQADDPLPSIRSLAKDLRISVITTTRAYDDLERDGFLYKIPGKGCYVSRKNHDLVREGALNEIRQKMEEIRTLAASAGLDRDTISNTWNEIWEDKG